MRSGNVDAKEEAIVVSVVESVFREQGQQLERLALLHDVESESDESKPFELPYNEQRAVYEDPGFPCVPVFRVETSVAQSKFTFFHRGEILRERGASLSQSDLSAKAKPFVPKNASAPASPTDDKAVVKPAAHKDYNYARIFAVPDTDNALPIINAHLYNLRFEYR